jgi:hypothetical protein
MPGPDPGTRCTTVSGYLSVTYFGTDDRIMSGHDDAGKGASVSMLTPVVGVDGPTASRAKVELSYTNQGPPQ